MTAAKKILDALRRIHCGEPAPAFDSKHGRAIARALDETLTSEDFGSVGVLVVIELFERMRNSQLAQRDLLQLQLRLVRGESHDASSPPPPTPTIGKTMDANPHVQTLVAFMSRQMDGERVPPSDSNAFAEMERAIGSIQKNASDRDLQQLGLLAMGAVIDRFRGSIAAEKALRDFIRPGAGGVQ